MSPYILHLEARVRAYLVIAQSGEGVERNVELLAQQGELALERVLLFRRPGLVRDEHDREPTLSVDGGQYAADRDGGSGE